MDLNWTLSLPSLSKTVKVGAAIAKFLKPGHVVLLQGDLGAGKTELARAILKGLGVQGPIPSPTFTILYSYESARGALYHFDLYRLESPEELREIAMEEALDHGIVMVEWPEKAGQDYFPWEALHVRLVQETLQETRSIFFKGGELWAPLKEFLQLSFPAYH